jgi:hypothetical protein
MPIKWRVWPWAGRMYLCKQMYSAEGLENSKKFPLGKYLPWIDWTNGSSRPVKHRK